MQRGIEIIMAVPQLPLWMALSAALWTGRRGPWAVGRVACTLAITPAV